VPVIVIADDLSPYAWDSYLDDCQQLYQTQVIPVSNIATTRTIPVGWHRQQIAKLHLDQIIPFDSWFFSDGDIVFLHAVDPEHTPYTIPDWIEVDQLQTEYVKLLLGISPGIYVNSKQVCVSDPAFRTMRAKVLQQLRNQVGNLILQTGIGMSEWELIENFRQHILGEHLTLIKYAPQDIRTDPATLNYFTHQFLTHYGTDKDLGKEYFLKYDIDVSDDMWNKLSKISK
jgi:hypothetical protein